jgi:4-amino-4-deoxy-L-arabinose transferase-like glycosyltransferase
MVRSRASSIMTQRRVNHALLVFGIAALVAVAVIFGVWRTQSLVSNRPDPYYFSAMGKSLVRGEGFTPYGTLLHRRAPLYPLFLAAIYAVFGERELVAQLFQGLLFAGTCYLAFDMGRRIYNLRTGLLAGFACMLHPSLLRYVADFHLETLLTFLLTLMVWLSVRFKERPTLARAAQFGVAAGLATLTKAVALLYPGVFALLLWWSERRASKEKVLLPKPVLMLAVAAVAMALTIVPWTIRNYSVSGHFVPVSTGFSDAVLRGYIFSKTEYATLQRPPYTDAENESNALFNKLCADKGTVWERDDYETDKILNEAMKAKLAEEPGGFVRKFFVGLFTFWYEMTGPTTSLVAGTTALVGWILAGFGLARSRHEEKPAWLLLAPILYLNVLLALLLALGRYSVPVLPCLMVLAAFGVDTLLDKYKVAWLKPAVT